MAVSYIKRTMLLIAGLLFASAGIYMSIQANIGLGPWEAFASGLSIQTGASFGDMSVAVGIALLITDFFMKEKIGIGSIINAVGIGKLVDLFDYFQLIPKMTGFLPGLGLLVLGTFLLAVGSCFFVAAKLGCGPRDALMVGLGKRFPKWPIGLVRACIEGVALLLGWLLGAKIGLGTLVAVFGVSASLQIITKTIHMELRAVPQESVLDTIKIITKKTKEPT